MPDTLRDASPRPRLRTVALLAAGLLIATACTAGGDTTQDAGSPGGGRAATGDGETAAGASFVAPEIPEEGPFRSSPWWPYLSAHADDEDPREVVGGPITVTARQEQGRVNWVLPGKRELDPAVFGTADAPRGTEGPPMLIGVPPPLREAADGGGRRTSQPVPFSDEFAPPPG